MFTERAGDMAVTFVQAHLSGEAAA